MRIRRKCINENNFLYYFPLLRIEGKCGNGNELWKNVYGREWKPMRQL